MNPQREVRSTEDIIKEYNDRFGFLDNVVERHCIPNATEENGNAWNYGKLIRAFIKEIVENERSLSNRYLEALKKYGRHGIVGGDLCEKSKHSDYPCTCGLDKSYSTEK